MISIRLPAAGLTFNTLSGFFWFFKLNHPLIVTLSVGFVRLIKKKILPCTALLAWRFALLLWSRPKISMQNCQLDVGVCVFWTDKRLLLFLPFCFLLYYFLFFFFFHLHLFSPSFLCLVWMGAALQVQRSNGGLGVELQLAGWSENSHLSWYLLISMELCILD